MTAPLEFEIEAEPIPLSGLVRVRCAECWTPGVACAPDQKAVALCGGCRAKVARSATHILRLPAVPPPAVVREGSQKILAPEASERAELVPPEMVCPLYCSHDEPAPVTALADAAMHADWRVRVQHSRARNMQADGKQGAKVEDFWSVRFRRDGWAGYAVRRGAAWDGVCVTGAALPPFLALGVTELREWLVEPERPAEWYAAIRERVAAQDLAKKMRACPGPGECAWVDGGRGDHTHRANGDIRPRVSRKQAQHGN